MVNKHQDIIENIPLWKGKIEIKRLEGGLTNLNYIVKDDSSKYVVRLGEDILEHHVLRSNEVISSKAAYEVGVGPEVIFHDSGILVLKYIESKTLSSDDVKKNIDQIISLIKKVHLELPKKLYGPAMIFWVFHVIRNYGQFLLERKSKYSNIIDNLLNSCSKLENLSSPHKIVFGHNDLLPANFLDDGKRIWLIDWEYSGFNNPLFDLGGIASNNNFSLKEEEYLLENYFEKKLDQDTLKKYNVMKCASLLRETMWSMVSEITSKIDYDYSNYTSDNFKKFENSFKELS